jgi:hypothetical protein
MDPNGLAPWRDLSLVWLILWQFIFLLIPGAAFYFAARGMRYLNRWIKPHLKTGQIWALRIQQGTTKTSDRIAGVPISLHSTAMRVNVTTRSVADFLRGK